MKNFGLLFRTLRGKVRNSFRDAPPCIEEAVVIIHSPFKTGTTTIGRALVILGLGEEDHGYHQMLNVTFKEQINQANYLALKSRSFEHFERAHGKYVRIILAQLIESVRGFQIFGDVPLGHLRMHPFAKKLIMPNARFIWINRRQEAWLESAKRWHLAHPEIYPGYDARWQLDPDAERDKLIRLRDEGFREFARLMESFPKDCLVLSLEEDANWLKLCSFFQLSEPEMPFPVLNTANELYASRSE